MSSRTLADELRRAFATLTREPPLQLTERIRTSLSGQPAPTTQRPTFAVALAALTAAVLVIALVAGAGLLEGPAMAREVDSIGSGLGRVPRLLSQLSAPRVASTPARTLPASVATGAAGPSPMATAAVTPTPEPTPSAVAPTPPPPGPAAAPPLRGFTCSVTEGGAAAPGAMTTARVGAHDGYDRFVVQFGGALPQFTVQPQGSATFLQGGDSVTLDGSAGLLVTLQNATGAGSYSAPSDFRPGYAALLEAKLLRDSDGVVQWAIGMARQSCYHAWTLDGPSRLVIDVQD